MKKLVKNKGKIAGIAISILFIVLICKNLDVNRLLATFKIFNYKTLFLFVPLYVFSLYLRGLRWKYLLCSSKNLSVKDAFYYFTAGSAINSYFPARAGDFWRACHVGNVLGMSRVKVLGSIIFERLIDGISVLLILLFAVIFYCKQQWVLNITYLASALFVGSLLFFFVIFKLNRTEAFFEKLSSISFFKPISPFIRKLSSVIINFMDGFESLNNPKCFSLAFAASCAAWGIECLVTYALICGFGFQFGFSVAMFVISFLALSTIIPSSSVFVGPYQYAYILALGIYGVEKSNALGVAFIHQIAIMSIITVISIIYFALNNTKLTEITELNDIKEISGEVNNV